MYIALSVLVLIPLLVLTVGYFLSGPVYKGVKSPHFNGKRFRNPSGIPANGFKDVLKFIINHSPEKTFYNPNAYVHNGKIPSLLSDDSIRVYFVNHSTFLIQVGKVNMLTDPIWSKRCSPFQFSGPARLRPPGITFEDLPEIHLVLISHNHYDHLDKNTVKRLIKEHNPSFITTLGVEKYLMKLGAKNAFGLDWWENSKFKNLIISCTPANHFSSRGLFDRDQTLWGGFNINANGKNIYYVGDTGYSDIFKEIPKKIGKINLALIPIGAYSPEWFMGPIHVTPEQAIQIHKDVSSEQSIAMHYGTFPLAEDAPASAIKRLKANIEVQNIDPINFIILEEGKAFDLNNGK